MLEYFYTGLLTVAALLITWFAIYVVYRLFKALRIDHSGLLDTTRRAASPEWFPLRYEDVASGAPLALEAPSILRVEPEIDTRIIASTEHHERRVRQQERERASRCGGCEGHAAILAMRCDRSSSSAIVMTRRPANSR